jgi:hypothetical protein
MGTVNSPQGSPAALGMVNVGTPEPVEANKAAAFRDNQFNGGPTQDLTNIGAGIHAHLAAEVATAGVGIHLNASG